MELDRTIELTRLIESRRSEIDAMKRKAEAETRHLDGQEQTKIVSLMNDMETYAGELEIEKRASGIKDRLNKSAQDPNKPAVDSRDELQIKYPGLPVRELRFSNFGEQLVAIRNSADPSQGIDRRLIRATGSSEGVPSDGGFLVQQDFSTELINRVKETSPVISRVRRIPVSGNGLKINAVAETSRSTSIWGGIVVYRKGEAAEKTASKPEFRQMELSLKKIIGLWYTTDELLQDAVALEAIANTGFAEAIDLKIEEEIMNGTGGGQMLGIMNSAALITVLKETGQLADTIQYENIVKMWARLWSRSMPNAVWLISQSVLPQLFTMGIVVGLGGAPVYTPPGGASATPYGSLFGRPVLPIECCQPLGDKGDIVLCDLSQYLMIEKGGVQSASSIHVNFKYDESVYRWVVRNDGQPIWNSALTPKDGSASVSPFVCLEARV